MSSAGCQTGSHYDLKTCIPLWAPEFAQGGIFATDGSSPWGSATRVYVKCGCAGPPRAAATRCAAHPMPSLCTAHRPSPPRL